MGSGSILIVMGTRPEAIKLAPVVYALASAGRHVSVCVTGQHVELLNSALSNLRISVDHRLSISPGERNPLTAYASVLDGMSRVLSEEQPEWTVVQGDTASALAAATASFHHRIPVAHVEAGLRSGDPLQPWPEEMYRRLLSRLATLHFAPTEIARDNLLKEGVAPSSIELTGNTVVDALRIAGDQLNKTPSLSAAARDVFDLVGRNRLLIVATVHRREAFGNPMASIGAAFLRLAERGDCEIVVIAHPNPATTPLLSQLAGHAHLHVIPPMEYFPFIALLRKADLVMTDSGGIQEEAAALGRPILVLRNCTERPEVITGGNGRLVGWDCDNIVGQARDLLENPPSRLEMGRLNTSYGDGRAAQRIAARLSCISENISIPH